MTNIFSVENRANTITYSRVLACFLMVLVAPFYNHTQKYLALLICAYLAITDKLDGTIARSKYGKVTDKGKKLDPLADKFSIFIVYAIIFWHHMIPLWIFALIVCRDIYITHLRGDAEKQGIIISAQPSGKIKTAIAFGLALLLLARTPISEIHPPYLIWAKNIIGYIHAIPENLILLTIYCLALVTIYSIFEYKYYYRKVVSLMLSKKHA